MDHQEAARIQAPERYLLGQLTAPQQEAFEEHFFDCADCAEEVRTGAIFAANARAVFHDSHPAPVPMRVPERGPSGWSWLPGPWAPAGGLSLGWSRSWLQLVPTVAAGLLLCVVGYDQLLIRQLTQPRSTYEVVAKTGTKGPRGNAAKVPSDQPFFNVAFTFDFPDEHEDYVCDVESASGKRITSQPIQLVKSSASPRFTITLKRSNFPDGEYFVKLRRPGSETVEPTYSFQLTH